MYKTGTSRQSLAAFNNDQYIWKLEARDNDIREAKLALREKQEELSEMILRKELAEKRLATQQHEHELTVVKLKRNFEEVHFQLKKKEKEFEETMDHLQTDIDSLESERGQLKEKLKSIGKKNGGPTTPGNDGAPSIIGISTSGSTTPLGVPMQESALYEKIQALQDALKHERRQKQALINESLQKKLDSLTPLPNFDKPTNEDPKIKELLQKKNELLKEVKKIDFFPTVPDITGRKLLLGTEEPILSKILPIFPIIEREKNLIKLQEKVDQLSSQVREETIKRTYGGQAESQFAVFPARHIAAALKNKKHSVAAEIEIPHKGPPEVIKTPVGTQDLRNIHMLLSY